MLQHRAADATSASLRRAQLEGHACRAPESAMDNPTSCGGCEKGIPPKSHSLLFAKKCQNQLSPSILSAMFTEEYPLPGSQGQLAVANRNDEGTAGKRCLNVRRHVVAPFDRMAVRKIFRSNLIKHPMEVRRYVGVCCFIDCQRCGCMPNEYVEQPHPTGFEFGQRFHNVSRNRVKPLTEPWKMNFSLDP